MSAYHPHIDIGLANPLSQIWKLASHKGIAHNRRIRVNLNTILAAAPALRTIIEATIATRVVVEAMLAAEKETATDPTHGHLHHPAAATHTIAIAPQQATAADLPGAVVLTTTTSLFLVVPRKKCRRSRSL